LDDVHSDRHDRDQKSRHILRKLRAGAIPYLLGPGRFKCPWCNHKELSSDFLSMYQHATYTGVGSGQTAAHIRAKHASYSLFLKKYAPRQ
jgi:transcription elongation factor Elf1